MAEDPRRHALEKQAREEAIKQLSLLDQDRGPQDIRESDREAPLGWDAPPAGAYPLACLMASGGEPSTGLERVGGFWKAPCSSCPHANLRPLIGCQPIRIDGHQADGFQVGMDGLGK